MHERELKVLWRGGALLAIASVFRLAAGGSVSGEPLKSASVLDSLLVASRAEQGIELRRARPLGAGEKVNPNTADAAELARLPRIGPALAARVVEERTARGAFASLQDLGRVRGIGPSLLQQLAGRVTLPTGPTRSPTPANQRSGDRPRQGRSGPGRRIDINRAGAAELVVLPGVGAVIAARIVAYREEHGRFKSVQELLKVRGIGQAKLGDIKAALEAQTDLR